MKRHVMCWLVAVGAALTSGQAVNETCVGRLSSESLQKCQKSFESSLKYISSQKSLESKDEKQLMFCCALNDVKTCLKALVDDKCDDRSSADAVRRLLPINATTETALCDTTDDTQCDAKTTHWLLSSVVVTVVVAVAAFLCFVISRDRRRIFVALKSRTEARDPTLTAIRKSKSFFL